MMKSHFTSTRAWPPSLLLAFAMCASIGCQQGQFGSELKAQPPAQLVGAKDGTTLRLPADQAFNVSLARDTREPGLGGTAEADARAKTDGIASASARVEEAGLAEGMFQVGHAVGNALERQCDFHFKVHCKYAFEADSTAEEPFPDAMVGLRLYAKEGKGPILRDILLVDFTTEEGAIRHASTETHEFTLTLAPQDSVCVFLAGRARAEVSRKRSASCALTLEDLEIEITTTPAPPVRTASDEQP